MKELVGTSDDPSLAECWFWLAEYGPTPVVPKNWKTWTMWQYTDGALGPKPHTVKGLGRCDRDKFNGSETELRKLWGAPEPSDISSASTAVTPSTRQASMLVAPKRIVMASELGQHPTHKNPPRQN